MAIAKTPRWAIRLDRLTDSELRELYDSQGDPNSWESFKQEVRSADGILGKFYADKRTMTLIGDDWLTSRLDNHISLHPDNKTWVNFLKGTELREEINGWKHYISSNGHYIVSPTGEVKVFHGYHGQNAFDKLSQRGLVGTSKEAKLAKDVPSGLTVKKVKGGYEVIHTKSGNSLFPFAYPEKDLATDFARRAGQVGVDWTRPFPELQKESEKIADLIRGGKKPGMFEKVLDMPTTFPSEREVMVKRKPLKDMSKDELKKLRVVLHILPDGTMEIKEKGADSLERGVASWNPPNRPDATEHSRVGGYVMNENVADNAKKWLDMVAERYDLDMNEIVADSWRGGGMKHKESPYKSVTNTFTGKVKTVGGSDTVADKPTDLQAIHDSRSPRSKSADESQSNALTLEPDDPRVDIWERDPGRADVKGIDTPRKRKIKSPPKPRPKRSSNTPTQVRGLR